MRRKESILKRAIRLEPARGWIEVKQRVSLAVILAALLLRAVPSNAADGEFARLLEAGTAERGRGNLVQATEDIEAAVTLEPQNPEGWFQLGLLYVKTTNFPSAEMAFRKAIALDPHRAQAHFWLGWTLIINPQGKLDWSGAVAESRAALLDKPDYGEALNLLGTGLINLGQLDQAVAALKQAVQIEPTLTAAHFNLASALEKSGHPEEARSEYEAAAKGGYPEASSALGKLLLSTGKPAEAEQELRKALGLNPDLDDAHYALARALQTLKKTADAQVEFDEAADLAQRQADGIQSMHLSNESLELAAKGDFTGAAASLRNAVALKPDYGVPHYNLGLILADRGDMKGAIQELRVAISLLPGQAKPWFDLGRVYERQGDNKSAFEAFSVAARLAPGDAVMEAKLKSFATPADSAPQQALPSGHQRFDVSDDTAADHFSAAEKLSQQGEHLDAVGELLRALALLPADIEARRSLAAAYQSLGNSEHAILEYHKLLLVSPQDASAHVALGRVLLNQGRAEQAATQFRAALAYQPNSPEARASLADALRASAAHRALVDDKN